MGTSTVQVVNITPDAVELKAGEVRFFIPRENLTGDIGLGEEKNLSQLLSGIRVSDAQKAKEVLNILLHV